MSEQVTALGTGFDEIIEKLRSMALAAAEQQDEAKMLAMLSAVGMIATGFRSYQEALGRGDDSTNQDAAPPASLSLVVESPVVMRAEAHETTGTTVPFIPEAKTESVAGSIIEAPAPVPVVEAEPQPELDVEITEPLVAVEEPEVVNPIQAEALPDFPELSLSEGQLVIMRAIDARRGTPFRPAEIQQETGCSPQMFRATIKKLQNVGQYDERFKSMGKTKARRYLWLGLMQGEQGVDDAAEDPWEEGLPKSDRQIALEKYGIDLAIGPGGREDLSIRAVPLVLTPLCTEVIAIIAEYGGSAEYRTLAQHPHMYEMAKKDTNFGNRLHHALLLIDKTLQAHDSVVWTDKSPIIDGKKVRRMTLGVAPLKAAPARD